MMGDGELMQACKSVCNGEQITYLGNCSDTRPYLSISDYYISPSLSEGFPTAVLEALSMGLGCILSDIPPHIEMLNNFENAIFFQKQNITDLKEKLESAFGVYQENLKKEARIYFIQNLSAKKMCERHFMIYQNILQMKVFLLTNYDSDVGYECEKTIAVEKYGYGLRMDDLGNFWFRDIDKLVALEEFPRTLLIGERAYWKGNTDDYRPWDKDPIFPSDRSTIWRVFT